MNYIVATFYHFFDFAGFEEKREAMLEKMTGEGLCGSILIAPEGFNGTIAGSREGIDRMLAYLATIGGAFSHKESVTGKKPFKRAKVRLKKETISIGEPCPPELVGDYVEPKDWNQLIADPDTIVLDTRNVYETYLGTFKNAIDPNIRNFKELPTWVRRELADKKDKKIATFCTGGIRCEKFTAWMKAEGFDKVYHLKGGILKYLEEIPEQESRWDGECYVFDDRIAVGHGLHASTTASMCGRCGQTLKPEDREHPEFKPGESCQFCEKNLREKYGAAIGSEG